jgi:hypothetical protein
MDFLSLLCIWRPASGLSLIANLCADTGDGEGGSGCGVYSH